MSSPSETIAQEIASLADDCRDYTRDAHGVYLMAVGAGMDMPSAADHLGPITNAAALIYTALKGLTDTLTALAGRNQS